MKVKIISSFLLIVAIAFLVNGCGKKGGPFPPEGSENKYPKQYPQTE